MPSSSVKHDASWTGAGHFDYKLKRGGQVLSDAEGLIFQASGSSTIAHVFKDDQGNVIELKSGDVITISFNDSGQTMYTTP
jgi:hypothetical protein